VTRAPDQSLPDGSHAPEDDAPLAADAFVAPGTSGPALELARPPRESPASEPRVAEGHPPAEPDWRQVARDSAKEYVREDLVGASTLAGAFLVSIPASLLPARWRRHLPAQLPWAAGTMISGWAEAFVAAGLLVTGFDRGALPGGAGAAVTWGIYLLSPAGLLLQWHLAEGLARAASAMTMGEPLGTAGLWMLAQLEARLTGARLRAQLPERPSDLIKRHPDGRLCQVAAAVRLPWDHLTTIRFEEQLYLVTYEGRAEGHSRPYVYDLGLAPPQRVVRGLVDYVPFLPANQSLKSKS
jgi:hypothetical protein